MDSSRRFIIILSKGAAKYIEKASKSIKKRIEEIFEKELSVNPFYSSKIKRLHGQLEGFYRYREGNLRIIYKIENDKLIVYVYEIGSRGDIYK